MSNRWFLLTLLLVAIPSMALALREESLERSPISITSVSQDDFKSTKVSDLNDVLNRYSVLPVTTGIAGGQQNQQITLRGLGSSRPGLVVDGVPIQNQPATGSFAFIDVERVEVLRGPQGTLYGRNALDHVVSKIIRNDFDYGSMNFDFSGTNVTGSSGFADNAYVFNGPGQGLDSYNSYYDPQFARDMLSGNAVVLSNQFNRWGGLYSKLTFDALYSFGKSTITPSAAFSWPTDAWVNEENKWVINEGDGYPNDPLYPKAGSDGKTSTARKAIGSIFNLIGAPVQVADDEASAQWGLPATGFNRRGDAKSAWDIADGEHENVVVAVIDSGLDLTHADGPRYVWTNPDEIATNGIDDDQNGYVDDINGWNFVSETNDITDDHGHGTFVAGIIAAKTNNGEGIAGINPGARIMPLKVLNGTGKSRILAVYRAIRYAVDNGARVLNLSLGGRGITKLEQVGINYAYAMGCIVVVAAGNEDGDVAEHGPPGARRAFSVAAINMDDKPRGSSNYGLNVAVAAPGHSIYSLTAKKGVRDGIFMPIIPGQYFRASGTSFSAPFVAGTASLIWSRFPDLSNRMIEDMILQSTKDIHKPGWDPQTGYGLLDGYEALKQDPGALLAPRITEVYINKVKRSISSVDVYGVIRGNLDHYVVRVGRGKKPGKWETVHGPVTTPVDHRLISRINGIYFSKGDQWSIRVDAVDRNKRTKSVLIVIRE